LSLSLLLPAGLFALLALALPLLMHLQRRRQTPAPRLFAALAYVDPQALPRERVRLFDWPLLLLRLLLLAAIALLLAQPLLHGRAGPEWVLLWPGLDPARAGALPEGAELRWLLPDFPRVDAQAAPPTVDDHFAQLSLLRQLAFERPLEQKLSLRLPARIEGLDGALPALGREIGWQVVESEVEPVASVPAAALQVAVLGEPPAAFASLQNFFASEAEPRVLLMQAQAEGAAEVLLQFGAEPLPDAWQKWLHDGGRVLRIDDRLEAGCEGSGPLRLAAGAPQAGADAADGSGGHGPGAEADDVKQPSLTRAASKSEAAVLWQGQRARLVGERIGAGELRTLDCALAPARLPELFEGDFPDLFTAWLAAPAEPVSEGIAQALAPIEGGPTPQPAGAPLRTPLLWLIVLLLAAERWLAASRPRA
jgi:hypothetical protein